MKTLTFITLCVAVVAVLHTAAAREMAQPAPDTLSGWLCLQSGPRQFSLSGDDLQKLTRQLPQGQLVPVFQTKEKHGVKLARVGALSLATGKAERGWVQINPTEVQPPETYPRDDELLRALGGTYLDDLTSRHTDIARFIVRQAHGPPLLLCYLLTGQLSVAKLVIFKPDEGRYLPNAALNFTLSDIRSGIISLEIRNLMGDESDCIITKEAFRDQAQTYGDNLFIRTIAVNEFRIVWQAPVEFTNLSQFGSKIEILQPPERNIGAPGTVTTGDVTFRRSGKGQEPVWTGKVAFFVFGRERPIDFVKIEKACPWTGKEFAPLR